MRTNQPAWTAVATSPMHASPEPPRDAGTAHEPCALHSKKPFDSDDEAMFVLFSASAKVGSRHQRALLLRLHLKGPRGREGRQGRDVVPGAGR